MIKMFVLLLLLMGCDDARQVMRLRAEVARLKEDMKCVADGIPLERWGHVMGTTYAAYPDTGNCGIIYKNILTGEVSVDRRRN